MSSMVAITVGVIVAMILLMAFDAKQNKPAVF